MCRGVLALVEIGKAVCTICPIRRPQRMLISSVAHPQQVLPQRCHRRHQRGLGAGRPGGCLPLLQRLVAMSLWLPRRNRRWRTSMPWGVKIWRWRDDILSRLRSSCALFGCLLRTSRWASAHQNRIDLLLKMSSKASLRRPFVECDYAASMTLDACEVHDVNLPRQLRSLRKTVEHRPIRIQYQGYFRSLPDTPQRSRLGCPYGYCTGLSSE